MLDTEHRKVRWIYFVTLTVLCLLLAYAAWVLLIPVLAGFLMAFLSEPLVQAMERKGIKRGVAATLLFLLLAIICTLALRYSVPVLHEQLVEFGAQEGEYLVLVEKNVEQLRLTLLRFLPEQTVTKMEADARQAIKVYWQNLQDGLPGMALSLLSALATGIFIPIIAVLFLLGGAEMKKQFVALLPNRYFEMTLMMLHKVNSQLGGYIRGQFLDCLIIGSMHGAGLLMLDVKGALFFALFAGIANAVPYAGPVLGAIPPMVLLFLDPSASSPWWSVPLLFIFVNFLDNVAVYPLTVGKSLQLSPLAVILGILFGGLVAGIPGMLVTVPLMGIVWQTFHVMHTSLKSYRII